MSISKSLSQFETKIPSTRHVIRHAITPFYQAFCIFAVHIYYLVDIDLTFLTLSYFYFNDNQCLILSHYNYFQMSNHIQISSSKLLFIYVYNVYLCL